MSITSSVLAQSNLDTTITKEEYFSLKTQQELVYEKNLMIYDYRKIMIKNNSDILLLNNKIKVLTNKINQHNLTLKKSQEKFKIETN